MNAIETGLPTLYGACEMEPTPDEQEAARLELERRKEVFFRLIP